MRGSIASLWLMIGAVVSPAFAQTVDHYEVGTIEVIDLGTLGGPRSYGWGINDLGDVVGSALAADGKRRAFIHTDGAMLSLHGSSPTFDGATAYDINNAREVVGEILVTPEGRLRGFYYRPGIWLTTISSDASFPMGHDWYARAFAINENGRIVGTASRIAAPGETPPVEPLVYKACYDSLPVRWADSTTLPWPIFCITDPDNDHQIAGTASANDVNDSDSIVGEDSGTSLYSMFLYKNGTRYIVPAPAGLPTTISAGVTAHGIGNGVNNQNHVVGEYSYREIGESVVRTRAYFWDGVSTKSVNLGVLSGGVDSRAYKLNERDMVVGGASWQAKSGTTVGSGFIWHADFGIVKLPPLGYKRDASYAVPRDCVAVAINELKFGQVQVAGTCNTDDTESGGPRAVRWDVKIQTYYNH